MLTSCLRPLPAWGIPFLLLTACDAKADIVGGQPVSPSDPIASSTVALYDPSPDGKGGALCTASLIGDGIAVTAAHCIDPRGPSPVLLFGRDIHSASAVKRTVTGYRIHPKYGTRAGMDQGDIAVVKFPGGLPKGYHAIGTADSEAVYKKGERAVLAGYGISNAGDPSGAGRLRKTAVLIADPRARRSEMILDQSHGHGACHGDSGGPAFIRQGGKPVLAGVTNRSYPAGAPDDCAHQVVYTKLPAYRSWIEKQERELGSERLKPAAQAFRKPRARRALRSAAVRGRHGTRRPAKRGIGGIHARKSARRAGSGRKGL